ncbi:flagellar biosynthesis protein FlaG [Cellvibrio mixtus]|uniref:Flagellar biosynthesis protein FlaG n=1 Tax=Cellvibrio mixtus TaxID=39650 RepID=A0A266Q6Q5_9GAMM|nr:flagellar protein FlaG [Cellvibrio mixtus]OZY85061.1 flagellar biosynthesis protein FlaG [Cellvibrio mixtus]
MMNEITKVAAGPVQVKSVSASSLVGGAQGQKTGNDLPPIAEAAKPVAVETVNSQAVQEKVQAAVAQMNEYIQSTQRDLNFTYDPTSGETVVKVLDRNTQEVIRQIPDEVFLHLAQQLTPDEPVSLISAQA